MASILDFGGAGDGLTDNTPALNAAAIALASSGDKTLNIPGGSFVFKSQPAVIPFGLRIAGAGSPYAILRKQFDGGAFLHYNGAAGAGGLVSNVCLYADPGFAVGSAIQLDGAGACQPEYWCGEDLYITGPGNWWSDILIDGINNLSPQGIRGVTLSRVRLFNAIGAALWMRNIVDFSMMGGGVYQGSGTVAACGAWVAGGGTPGTDSTLADFIAVKNNGVLNLTNCGNVNVLGGEIGSLATDASSHCYGRTRCSGAVVNNLTASDFATI